LKTERFAAFPRHYTALSNSATCFSTTTCEDCPQLSAALHLTKA
jgi:hypothetical protein